MPQCSNPNIYHRLVELLFTHTTAHFISLPPPPTHLFRSFSPSHLPLYLSSSLRSSYTLPFGCPIMIIFNFLFFFFISFIQFFFYFYILLFSSPPCYSFSFLCMEMYLFVRARTPAGSGLTKGGATAETCSKKQCPGSIMKTVSSLDHLFQKICPLPPPPPPNHTHIHIHPSHRHRLGRERKLEELRREKKEYDFWSEKKEWKKN